MVFASLEVGEDFGEACRRAPGNEESREALGTFSVVVWSKHLVSMRYNARGFMRYELSCSLMFTLQRDLVAPRKQRYVQPSREHVHQKNGVHTC